MCELWRYSQRLPRTKALSRGTCAMYTVDPLYDLLRGVRFDWSSQLVTGTNIVYMTEIIRHDALRWSEILVLR